MNTKNYVSAAIALTAIASLAVAILAFADTTPTPPIHAPWQGQRGPGGMHGANQAMMRPVVVGTVSAVNGDSLTVNGKQGFGSTTTTTVFTVDATNATVRKDNATSTVSSIAVGDTVAIAGTVNGTNVTATTIRDGMIMRGGPGGMHGGQQGAMGSSTPVLGNGQPVVAGTISAINGSTLTITNKSNVTYSVDASNAKILEGNTTVSLSNVAVGNAVLVQGTINGTSITASTVIDQTNPGAGAPSPTGGANPPHPGLFGGIGSFFMHLFGF